MTNVSINSPVSNSRDYHLVSPPGHLLWRLCANLEASGSNVADLTDWSMVVNYRVVSSG